MQMKILIKLGTTTIIFLFIFIVWFFIHPTIPSYWGKINIGMSRSIILHTVPGISSDMYLVKGIDNMYKFNTLPWYPYGYWHMSISYDNKANVKHIGYHYINRTCGLFNITRTKP